MHVCGYVCVHASMHVWVHVCVVCVCSVPKAALWTILGVPPRILGHFIIGLYAGV